MLFLGLRLGIAGSLAWGLLVGVREGYAYATTSPRLPFSLARPRPPSLSGP